MYDIDTRNIHSDAIIYYLFIACALLIVGVDVIIGCLFANQYLGKDSKVISSSVTINVSAGDEGEEYNTIYNYEVDGKSYSCNSNEYSNFKPSENNRMVYYDSSAPANCVTSPSWLLYFALIAVLAFAGVFFAIGFGGAKKAFKRLKDLKKLRISGTLVRDLPYELVPSNTYVNGVNIPRIKVKYTLPNGKELTLKSAPLMYGANDEDGDVDLLIDLDNPSNYYIAFSIAKIIK